VSPTPVCPVCPSVSDLSPPSTPSFKWVIMASRYSIIEKNLF